MSRLGFPSGHSISSHSSARAWLPWAAFMRTRAKSEDKVPLVPSRQLICCQPFGGKARASSATESG